MSIPNPSSVSDRVILTPSAYARAHYLYAQEIGSLRSLKPHISSRDRLDSFLFLIVLTGKGELTYRSQTFSLKQGDCAWIDCHLPYSHESSSVSPWELKWVHFSGQAAPEFYRQFANQNLPAVFTPENPALFNECLSALLLLHKSSVPSKELMSHAYLTQLISYCYQESAAGTKSQRDIREKLSLVNQYLHTHFSEQLSLDDLSQMFYISKYHLIREYRKNYGTTPGNALITIRISHAKELLRFTSDSVEKISSLCGFQDTAYFIRMFKRSECMTPLEYRRKW